MSDVAIVDVNGENVAEERDFCYKSKPKSEGYRRKLEWFGHMIIHCLWTVGCGRGKGYTTRRLDICVEDARQAGMHSVAMVTRIFLNG
ncbi:MAG: hypothetical protein GY803_17250 [Chloroflexi bacterium]|nr:hypothetical protein [Chloroflexota bacterium]